MANRYTIRLDVLEGRSDIPDEKRVSEAITIERLELFLKCFDKYVVSYEISEEKKKPHYQGIIFTDMKYETYKKKAESFFEEWKGKRGDKCGLRSFAMVRKDEYEIYVVKDGDLRFVKGYTEEEIAELRSKSYVKDSSKDKTKDKNNYNEDGRKKNWFTTLIDHCKSNGVKQNSDGWEIAKWIIDAYQVYVKCEPNDFQIKCYAKSIQRQLVYEHAIANDRKDLYDRYLRQRVKNVIGNEWVHEW